MNIIVERKGQHFDHTIFDDDGKVMTIPECYKQIPKKKYMALLNDGFLEWCKQNNYTPKVKKMSGWALASLKEDFPYMYIEEMSNEDLFDIILKYYGIIGYSNLIISTLKDLEIIKD